MPHFHTKSGAIISPIVAKLTIPEERNPVAINARSFSVKGRTNRDLFLSRVVLLRTKVVGEILSPEGNITVIFCFEAVMPLGLPDYFGEDELGCE